MPITYGNKVNRCYGLNLSFMKTFCTVNIFFHKNNTFIGFVIDEKINDLSRRGKANVLFYRDLKQSSFAKTFLDIRDFSSPTLDIRCQFSDILADKREKIQYVTNETIKLAKFQNPNDKTKYFESRLEIFVFNFADYDDDFLFFLVERQHIDQSLGKKLVRTGALQIYNKSVFEDLSKMMSFYNGDQTATKELQNNVYDVDSSIKDLMGGGKTDAF